MPLCNLQGRFQCVRHWFFGHNHWEKMRYPWVLVAHMRFLQMIRLITAIRIRLGPKCLVVINSHCYLILLLARKVFLLYVLSYVILLALPKPMTCTRRRKTWGCLKKACLYHQPLQLCWDFSIKSNVLTRRGDGLANPCLLFPCQQANAPQILYP